MLTPSNNQPTLRPCLCNLKKKVPLSVGLNCSDPDTARSLTKLLQVNKSITHLDLSRNNTCLHSGAWYILQGLYHNTTLVNLSLCETHITCADAISLANLLAVNKSLTHLDLSSITCKYYTSAGPASCYVFSRIFKGLQQNTALLHLNLCGAHIPDKSAKCIAQALIANQTLKSLNIIGSFLTDEGIRTILDALKYSCTTAIKQLHIPYNGNITEAIDDFDKARKDNSLPPICIISEVSKEVYYM